MGYLEQMCYSNSAAAVPGPPRDGVVPQEMECKILCKRKRDSWCMPPAERERSSALDEDSPHLYFKQEGRRPYKRPREDYTCPQMCMVSGLPCGKCQSCNLERDDRPTSSERHQVPDDNPKPLCMIPFNVSMSNAKNGNFKGANHPVFVYWVDKQINQFRIRLTVRGKMLKEMKAQLVEDGKVITKGSLAKLIAAEIERILTTGMNKREDDTGELFFEDLVQEDRESFRPNLRPLNVESSSKPANCPVLPSKAAASSM